MACECGWTKDYIYDNLSLPEIIDYYTSIQKHKIREYKLQAKITAYGCAVANGALKQDDWKDWVDSIGKPAEPPVPLNREMIKNLKSEGIEIEET